MSAKRKNAHMNTPQNISTDDNNFLTDTQKAPLLPSVCAVGCSSEGTDGGTGDTLDTVDCCVPAVLPQGQ